MRGFDDRRSMRDSDCERLTVSWASVFWRGADFSSEREILADLLDEFRTRRGEVRVDELLPTGVDGAAIWDRRNWAWCIEAATEISDPATGARRAISPGELRVEPDGLANAATRRNKDSRAPESCWTDGANEDAVESGRSRTRRQPATKPSGRVRRKMAVAESLAALKEGADPFGTSDSKVEGEFCKADRGPETVDAVLESARPAIDGD